MRAAADPIAGALDDAAVADLIAAAVRPELVLRRAQADGPGAAAVRAQVGALRAALDPVAERLGAVRNLLRAADEALDAVAAELGAR